MLTVDLNKKIDANKPLNVHLTSKIYEHFKFSKYSQASFTFVDYLFGVPLQNFTIPKIFVIIGPDISEGIIAISL